MLSVLYGPIPCICGRVHDRAVMRSLDDDTHEYRCETTGCWLPLAMRPVVFPRLDVSPEAWRSADDESD